MFWNGKALRTPFHPNIPVAEKIAGLSKLWSVAKYNFINFSLVPDLDWDKTYLEFIPQVMGTKSTLEYYRVLQKFWAQLKDGHSNIYFPNELKDQVAALPAIQTRLIEDRVIILRVLDHSAATLGLVPGQEILTIDKVPVRQYAKQQVAPYISASTQHDANTRIFESILMLGPHAKPVALTIRNRDGKIFACRLPRKPWSEISKLMAFKKPFEMKVLPGGVLLVKINSMAGVDKADVSFAQSFSEIQQSTALIIDLRDNGGGETEVAYRILAHLVDKPFKGARWYTREYRPVFRAWGRMAKPFNKDANEVTIEMIQKMRGTNVMAYQKPVAVLTSPRTFSAAEDFLVAFKPIKRGLIVGEPSGGSTGQPLFFPLPGGGRARICTKRDTFPDGTEFVGVGVRPDIVVSPKLSDITDGTDAVLEAALEALSPLPMVFSKY